MASVTAGPRFRLRGGPSPSAHALHPDVLVNEVRSELRGSIVAWTCLAVVTAILASHFAPIAEPRGFWSWLIATAIFLGGWLIAWVAFVARRPSDEQLLARWIPGAKAGMTLCNAATAGAVWVFFPVAEPEVRALLLVLFAQFLSTQFAAATEATQVLGSAVVMIVGSVAAWLLVARPPYFLWQALALVLFGATLIAIRRFVRAAVVQAAEARATADTANRSLAEAMLRLQQERDAKTRFIRAASHDLQQPLQAAALFADSLRPSRSIDQKTSLEGLRQALGSSRALVAAMLETLQAETAAARAASSTFAVGEVFGAVVSAQRPAALAAGVTLRTAGGGVRVHADRQLLTRAVANLVANAIRHSGGARVLLGARASPATVTIWVVDDGQGLGPGDEAHIFDAFTQGAHVGPAGGFGLGLASVRSLMEQMGGACGVRSRAGAGAAFHLTLPRPPPPVGDAPCTCRARLPWPGCRASGRAPPMRSWS